MCRRSPEKCRWGLVGREERGSLLSYTRVWRKKAGGRYVSLWGNAGVVEVSKKSCGWWQGKEVNSGARLLETQLKRPSEGGPVLSSAARPSTRILTRQFKSYTVCHHREYVSLVKHSLNPYLAEHNRYQLLLLVKSTRQIVGILQTVVKCKIISY